MPSHFIEKKGKGLILVKEDKKSDKYIQRNDYIMIEQENMENKKTEKFESVTFFFLFMVMGLFAFSMGYYLGFKNKEPEIIEKIVIQEVPRAVEPVATPVSTPEKVMDAQQDLTVLSSVENKFSSKFTIVMGAFPEMKAAKEFASGFIVRGYSPIIREISQNNLATVYKVSIGAYDTEEEAKNFEKNEKSLFENSPYPIEKID